MSRLCDLLADTCPDGVTFVRLSDTAELKRGNSITKKQIIDGDIPVVAGGRTAAYYHGESNRDGETIVVAGSGAYAGFVSWWEGPIFVSDAFSIKPNSEILLSKYCFYWLLSKQEEIHNLKRGGGVPHVYAKDMAKFLIPVPPLEIQSEIVRILDTFSKMEAELEAELEARKAQHAHYWSSLLTPNERWAETTLGAVAEVFDGPHATPKKTESGPWYLSISSLVDGRFDLSKSAHLSNEEYPQWTRRVEASVGDTMFSYETRLGQAAFWELDEPAALGRRMGILRPDPSKINPRFLTLLYLGPKFQDLIKSKTVGGSTVNRIPIRDMARWPIQIPPLEEQDRLVQALDAFDALVNDLSVGLPAELNARRQQYEYYRDRLLTFKELEPAS